MFVTVSKRFGATITIMQNIQDLSKISLAELLNALQAQEQRRVMRQDRLVERALTGNHYNSKCNQLRHEAVICRNQSQQQDVDAQIANEEEDEIFVATGFSNNISSASWLFDSGCTNHMTYDKELFKELMPSKVSKVKIGHGLLQKGFKVFFLKITTVCLINDAIRQDGFKVKMRGKSFSLDLFQEEQTIFSTKKNTVELWHKKLGQGLLTMQKSEMKDDPPIKGTRLLSDIYQRCNLAVCEPDRSYQ
ncbi:uncharacterized protein [Phaseolus vulgaris]|uniref:uncharacterized protein n=1 Tax=Phaseolus vulgaris TaxID=3885 RepID=UPI0035CBD864